MTAGSGTANMAALSRDFTALSSLVDTVSTQSNAQIDAEVASLEEQTLRARRRVLVLDSGAWERLSVYTILGWEVLMGGWLVAVRR